MISPAILEYRTWVTVTVTGELGLGAGPGADSEVGPGPRVGGEDDNVSAVTRAPSRFWVAGRGLGERGRIEGTTSRSASTTYRTQPRPARPAQATMLCAAFGWVKSVTGK